MLIGRKCCLATILLIGCLPCAIADDTERLAFDFAVRGIAQHGQFSNAIKDDGREINDRTQGATIADLALSFSPNSDNQFFAQLRYANGNGFRQTGGVSFAPYGGDLEDDVTDIGGRDRDYLREAWYRHRLHFSPEISLDLTAGLIDSPNYIAVNTFFGDEDSQFMNQVFSNNHTAQFPSYDPGGVIDLEAGDLSFTAVYMTPKTEAGRTYDYYAAQASVERQSRLGAGHLSVFAITTSDKFQNADDTDDDAGLKSIGLSLDQKLGPIAGVFAEVGFQDDEAAIDFDRIVTLGLNVNGAWWGRPGDEIGLAYGRANGASASPFKNSHISEAYIRMGLSESSDVSLDLQYIKDSLENSAAADDPELLAIGIRFNTYFRL
jgi:porin